jgi:hypothetical protein
MKMLLILMMRNGLSRFEVLIFADHVTSVNDFGVEIATLKDFKVKVAIFKGLGFEVVIFQDLMV